MTEAQKTRKNRAKRPKFDLTSAVDSDGNTIELDDRERLTAVPQNWTQAFRPLQKGNFADKGHFFEWLQTREQAKIVRLQERIEELKEMAEEARTGPDPTKVAVRKLQKMAKVAAELRAQLEAEGVDVSALDLG